MIDRVLPPDDQTPIRRRILYDPTELARSLQPPLPRSFLGINNNDKNGKNGGGAGRRPRPTASPFEAHVGHLVDLMNEILEVGFIPFLEPLVRSGLLSCCLRFPVNADAVLFTFGYTNSLSWIDTAP